MKTRFEVICQSEKQPVAILGFQDTQLAITGLSENARRLTKDLDCGEGSIEGEIYREEGQTVKFLDKLSSVFFYATPHSGSRAIEKFAANIPKSSQHFGLNLMKVLDKEMGRVNQRFTAYKSQTSHERYSRCRTYALHPIHKTKQVGGGSEKVVTEGSARNDIDSFESISADHFGVCHAELLYSNSMKIRGQRIREESVACIKRKPNAALNEMQKKPESFSGAETQNTPTERNTEVNDMKKAAGLRNVRFGHGSNIRTLQELKS